MIEERITEEMWRGEEKLQEKDRKKEREIGKEITTTPLSYALLPLIST